MNSLFVEQLHVKEKEMTVFIMCYIIVGIIWFLYKNYTHPVSDFYKEMSAEYKKNNQPMPHYASVVIATVLVTVAIWPVSVVTFVLEEVNKARGVK